MHEVRVTVPEGDSSRVAEVALAAGIKQVAVQKIYVHGPNHEMEVVSAETSTPCAKSFIDGLLSAPWFDPKGYSLTARELRAILTPETLANLTRPMVEPAVDVLEGFEASSKPDRRAISHETAIPWRRCRSLEPLPSFRRSSARPGP